MKNTKIIALLLLFIVSLLKINSQPYNPYGYYCDEIPNPPQLTIPLTGGQFKPESIDRYTSVYDAYFPVLVLFVQFANDSGPDAYYWHVGQNPAFYKEVISEQKRTSTNWWEAYNENTETLSDFWMEASRSHFHAVGQSFSIILPHGNDWYKRYFGTNAIGRINDDIYNILKTDYQDSINWDNYDRWTKDQTNNTFLYQPDGYVDMIYKVFRSHSPGLGMPAGGIAKLYGSYQYGNIYPIYANGSDTIKIHGDYNALGSGITITPGHGGNEGQDNYGRYAPMNKLGTISFSEHEHGHYLFGNGHQRYGKMMGAGADYGLDEFLSPYEELQMGYMTSDVVDFNTDSYSLNDFSSRNSGTQGEVLEVPINGSSEFFLIANRTKVSYYDKLMFGDTCHDDPYRSLTNGESPNYGKGLYIYHAHPITSGYPWGSAMDLECADGLFNWTYMGTQHPDWSDEQDVGYYKNTSVSFYNDNGGDYFQSINNHDGISIDSWFSIGKRHIYLGEDGTDRIYTNLEEVWTSRSNKGDRWDAWRVGYNEVFSPYSSPSTQDWNSSISGIFIYLESKNGSTVNLKIYKSGEGGWTEDAILESTPPSRPMVHYDFSVVECNSVWAHPQIVWYNNQELDMLRNNEYKRYKIYRAYSQDGLPVNYTLIDTYNDYTPYDTASYIDRNQAQIYCGSGIPTNVNEHFRYKIIAVDKFETESVYSDFINVKGYLGLPDKFINNTPYIFSLSQNYPNPFNPSTEIRFTIPKSTAVTLKVYNLLGQVVAVLINNEFKEAGSHLVEFDGSNLASGIYIYKIEAGNFAQSRKMVLIK
jgi:hypothetical protein